jgi:hypothetical protein
MRFRWRWDSAQNLCTRPDRLYGPCRERQYTGQAPWLGNTQPFCASYRMLLRRQENTAAQ